MRLVYVFYVMNLSTRLRIKRYYKCYIRFVIDKCRKLTREDYRFIDPGANYSRLIHQNTTGLHLIIRSVDLRTIKRLIHIGIDPAEGLFTGYHNRSHSFGTIDFIKTIHLMVSGGDINATDKDRRTILHHASIEGDTQTTKILLTFDPNVNARDYDDKTPLHEASIYGNLEIVKLLVEAGANTKARDINGQTPRNSAGVFGFHNQVQKEIKQYFDSLGN